MKQNEREALKRLIEYAKLEAEQQREDFAAYLLELARRSLDAPGRVSAASDLRQMQ
jgi:hypothetical protein